MTEVHLENHDGVMKVETERFSDSEVDILEIEYPAGWSDSTILAALEILEDHQDFRGDSIKNMSTWRSRMT